MKTIHGIWLTSLAFLAAGAVSPVQAGTPTYYTSLSAFNSAATTTLVEDFEAVTPKDTALASFVSHGNIYTGFAGVPLPNVFVASPGYTNFGVPLTTTSILTANGDEDFQVDFGTAHTAIGFDTYLNIYGPATIKIYDGIGLLDTYSLSQDSTKVGFFGVVSSDPITAIRWTTVKGSLINTGIDNIRTGSVAAVPEAGSFALLFGALPVVALLRRGQVVRKR